MVAHGCVTRDSHYRDCDWRTAISRACVWAVESVERTVALGVARGMSCACHCLGRGGCVRLNRADTEKGDCGCVLHAHGGIATL